jgi:hypothetical protein
MTLIKFTIKVDGKNPADAFDNAERWHLPPTVLYETIEIESVDIENKQWLVQGFFTKQ